MPNTQSSMILFGLFAIVPLIVFSTKRFESQAAVDEPTSTDGKEVVNNEEIFILTAQETKNVLRRKTTSIGNDLDKEDSQQEHAKEFQKWDRFWTDNGVNIKRKFDKIGARQSSSPLIFPQDQDVDREYSEYLVKHLDSVYQEATLLAAERLTAITAPRPLRECQIVDAMRFGFEAALKAAEQRFESLC